MVPLGALSLDAQPVEASDRSPAGSPRPANGLPWNAYETSY